MRKTDEQNTEQRRQQFLRAAITCFSRSGLHGTSMAKICAEAGVSTAHPYYYYKNKEALVEAVYRHDWDVASRFLNSLIDAPFGLLIYLGLVRSSDHVMQEDLVTGPTFGLEVTAESGRDAGLAATLALHRKRYVAKVTEIAQAAKKRGELVDGVSIADVVYAVQTVEAARVMALVTGDHDPRQYVKRATSLLKGLLIFPAV
jgi:AcrR family transcriptional regulator